MYCGVYIVVGSVFVIDDDDVFIVGVDLIKYFCFCYDVVLLSEIFYGIIDFVEFNIWSI